MDTSHTGEHMVEEAGVSTWWPLVEPSPRWVRVRLGEQLVADTRRALLQIQYGPGPLPRGFLPTYYVPLADVAQVALVDREVGDDGTVTWDVRAGAQLARRAAWMHSAPPPGLAALSGHVTFSWDDLDWYEEDERLLAHARDTHKRVDVVQSSRHVVIRVDGHVVAESARPLVLFETSLPTRYYLPAEDVRWDALEPSATVSTCPYKGVARYWTAQVDGTRVEDVAWSYPEPVAENPRIAGRVCFLNEKVDLVVDGEVLERPRTPWS